MGTRPGADVGRWLLVPLFGSLMAFNGLRLMTAAPHSGPLSSFGAVMSALLTTAFYAIALHAYLVRPRARATSRHIGVNIAAVVATWLPFVMPLLHRVAASGGAMAAGDGLLLVGLLWSVWSIRTLGRSLSIIPQARSVVSDGPYRLVRHPLYLGEITSMAGLALLRLSPATVGACLLLVCLQAYRARHEEKVLSAALPDYCAYAAGTPRLVPGLY